MESENRFVFESAVPGGKGSQHTCPSPNHKGNPRRQFTRFVDTETGALLPDHVGRCNNISKCGYFYHWSQFLRDNPDYLKNYAFTGGDYRRPAITLTPPKPVSYFPSERMVMTLTNYEQNNFVTYLQSIFPAGIVTELIDRYKIGTSLAPWPRSVIFWQLDSQSNTRSGKIMLYDPETGRRVSNPFSHCTWAHSLLKKFGKVQDFNLQQCLYGEHLINDSEKIAVVESEKTAIISSVYFPEYVWMATGSENGLTIEKCKVLKGKEVTLFPDKGCYELWAEKGKKLGIPNVRISSYIETLPVPSGGDLADYLPLYVKIPDRQRADKGYPPEWDF